MGYNSAAGEHHSQLAAQLFRDLATRSNVEIIPQTPTLFRDALDRFAERSDQTWSLTDCASFLVMEGRGITEALAYTTISNRRALWRY